MKLKLLNICCVMFIAQTHVAQGSPLVSLNLGGLVGSTTTILTGTVTTVTNTLNDTLLLISNVLNSITQAVGDVATQTGTEINNAIAAGGQLLSDGANLIANAAGDTVSTVNTALLNTAAQGIPIIDNTLAPITNFGNTISILITNNTALFCNPIDIINQAIAGLSLTLNLADLFQPAINLMSQGMEKAGEALQTIGATVQNALSDVATSIPASISSSLNALTVASGNMDNILTTASNLLNVLAAQAAAGTQSLSTSVTPITATLINPVNNIANAINCVPETINNAINGLENSAATLVALCNDQHQVIVSSLVAVGTACVNNASIATNNLATNTIETSGSCVTNEIPALQNYLTQFQNLAAQYQAGIASNTISTSTLQQTVQTSVNLKLHLLSVKFRLEGCIALTLLNAAGKFIPIAASAVKCII